MNEYSSTSVAELRKMLVESGKFTQEEVDKIKGKSSLVQAVLEIKNTEDPMFSTLVEGEVKPVTAIADNLFDDLTESVSVIQPTQTDANWHDYVLSHFTKDELEDGTYPNIFGLRRVAQLILGPIVQSGPTQLDSPAANDEGTGRASCVYTVVFRTKDGEIEFRAAGGASPRSIDGPYQIYPEAIAEVRAEARALRKALGLKCVSSEEVFKGNKQSPQPETTSTGEWSENDPIGAAQEMFIKTRLKENEIDLEKFLKHNGYNFDSLKVVNKKTAMEMMELIQQYSGSGKGSKPIPEDILIKKG